MSTTQPIKDREKLERLKSYYIVEKPNLRNHLLIIMGLNTALRISDILRLRWGDLYEEKTGYIREHLELTEHKTGKKKLLAINSSVRETLLQYYSFIVNKKSHTPGSYIFFSQKGENLPLCRFQAYRIVKEAAEAAGLPEHVSCHSLRKTFGYHAWRQGVPPALLMDIYNHSSYRITKRYLCIGQDEQDEVYRNISL